MRFAALVFFVVSMTAVARADEPTESDTCLRDPVRVHHLRRPREAVEIALTDCEGHANLEALVPLSLAARAWRTSVPTQEELDAYVREHPARARNWISPTQRRLHPGLLTRLQALADQWPDRTIIIVSGHRPRARRTSRHRVGRALDVQVDGVHRGEVARFARTLNATGVGFYPRSTFTHIDVRDDSAFWIDRSGPGQRADYGTWPGWDLNAPTEDAVRVAENTPNTEPPPEDREPASHDDVVITREEAQRLVAEAMAEGERLSRIIIRREQTWEPGPIDWTPP